MQIEPGDYIVVKRGKRIEQRNCGPFAMFEDNSDREPKYDDSLFGIVFEVMDVQEDLVAARIASVGFGGKGTEFIGQPWMLDLSKIEVQTVSKRFAQVLNTANSLTKEPDNRQLHAFMQSIMGEQKRGGRQ